MQFAKFKNALVFLTCFCCMFFGFKMPANAQAPQLVKLTPPSPNVTAFQKYGDIPISAYTGIPNISIPIYTVKFRDISIPISLSYHASGIKVAEEAGQVGLGWTLNAGGNISRNIMGQDDFNGSVYFNGPLNDVFDLSGKKGPTNYTAHGCILPVFDKSPGSTNTFFNVDLSTYLNSPQTYDFQPDQYYYNFSSKSGKFMLNRAKQAIIEKQESVAFTLINNGAAWRAVSEDGYIYDFAATETYQDELPPAVHNSAWHLTQITSPAGNTVTFHYIPNNLLVTSVGSYSESRDDYDVGIMGSKTLGSSNGFTPGKNYSNLILDYIDFTIGKVVFNYSANRTDLAGEKKLDNISVYNAGETTPVKTYSLIYDYFNGANDPSFNNVGATVSSYVSQRLKLTQLIETGYYNGQTIQNPPYVFSYNESNANPAKTSFARDHWGYFNGQTNKVTLIPSTISVNSTTAIAAQLGLPGPEREPNPFYASAFNIAAIKYPTGGWTEFQFDSNDFDETASQKNDFSYFNIQTNSIVQKSQTVGYDAVNKVYLGTTNTLDLTNEYVLPPAQGGGSPPVSISASFRFPGGTGGSCNDAGLGPRQVYFEIKDINGNLISHIDPGGMTLCSTNQTPTCVFCQTNSPVIAYTTTYQLPPGKYTWSAFVGTTGGALKLQDMRTIFSWYEPYNGNSSNSSGNNISTGGGLRIKRIIDHDGIDERNNKIKRYDYHYIADKTGSGSLQEYSYGRRMSKPEYSYFSISYDDNSANVSGCIENKYKSYHLIRTSDSNIPLNGSASGAVVGYDQVTELLGENGEYGKTVYKYTNEPDIVSGYNEDFTGLGLPMRPPYGSNIANPLNGSLLNEVHYANITGNYFKVKEETNAYQTIDANENIVTGLEYRTMPTLNFGDVCGIVTIPACDNTSTIVCYKALSSEWSYLSSKDEKIYNDRGDELHFAETLTNFYYDNPNHLQLTRTTTTNSKGQQITSTTKYPLDYIIPSGANDAFTQGIQNLQARHIINAPVEKYVQKQNSDASAVGATSYVLTSYGNNLPDPKLAYVSMIAAPNPAFIPASINSSGLVKDNAYQPIIYFDNYDGYGNLLQQHKVSDINHSYIWDYSGSQVIAEVTNAASNEIACTSFEADGTSIWVVPTADRNINNAITGNKSYTLTGTPITATVPSGKSYIVSYWSKNGALSVNGTSAVQGPSKNSWTYFEHILPSGTTAISVAGSGNTIDELRLYPKDAQMASYTYSPLIGITDVCSVNSTISYYFYDGLGRLQLIKDWDGNILKTFEYHFTGSVTQ